MPEERHMRAHQRRKPQQGTSQERELRQCVYLVPNPPSDLIPMSSPELETEPAGEPDSKLGLRQLTTGNGNLGQPKRTRSPLLKQKGTEFSIPFGFLILIVEGEKTHFAFYMGGSYCEA
ncbi:hypothetical protein Q3G72_017871 [Acer saccharum]|nr:hypothetical protein Q3G72_017871 [Acer saccharum]